MAKSIACYLWDYLRRSGARGYFLPLSGGADSAATASGVFHMCNLVYEAIHDNETTTLDDLRNVIDDKQYYPKNVEDIMNRLFYTSYLGSSNSSKDSRGRAR